MHPLPHENLLTALGEVAAAFVGFSLVVSVLRARSSDSAQEIRRLHSMHDVAEIGLGAVFSAFLPLVIHAFGASTDTTWLVASAGFLAASSLSAGASFWRRGNWLDGARSEPIQTVITMPLQLSALGLVLANFAAPGPSSGARYVAAILLSLAIGGVLFVNATFNTADAPPDGRRE